MLIYKCPKNATEEKRWYTLLDKNKLLGKIAERGYTQKRLAEEMGIGANTLSKKINGKSGIEIDEADLICKILGITEFKEKEQIFFAKPIPEMQRKFN